MTRTNRSAWSVATSLRSAAARALRSVDDWTLLAFNAPVRQTPTCRPLV